jgi:hypothetical protein
MPGTWIFTFVKFLFSTDRLAMKQCPVKYTLPNGKKSQKPDAFLHFHDSSLKPHSDQRQFNRARSGLGPRHNTPSADQVVGVTSEQGLAISAPRQANTLWLAALLADRGVLRLELVNLALLLEVEDDDAAGGGGAQPVSVW